MTRRFPFRQAYRKDGPIVWPDTFRSFRHVQPGEGRREAYEGKQFEGTAVAYLWELAQQDHMRAWIERMAEYSHLPPRQKPFHRVKIELEQPQTVIVKVDE